jgi:hypothetical protein
VAAALNGTVDVTQIFSTEYAFAALRTDGSVVTWGDSYYGGDSSGVAAALNGTVDVTQIFSTEYAFAALRTDGSVVTWGVSYYGGNSSAVAAALNGTVDVTQIFSTGAAFAALRTDGSVVSWGDSRYGADSSAVASQLDGSIDVTQIFSTEYAFAALRADGSVVTWGDNSRGGDSSAVASQLTNVVSMANPFTNDVYIAEQFLTGTTGPDTLTGNGGNNTLQGLAGNDTIDGGTGTDTAVFSGNRSGYTITRTSTGYTVSGGSDGTDTLANIEHVQFADQTLDLSPLSDYGTRLQVFATAWLGRQLTPDELVGYAANYAQVAASGGNIYATLLNNDLNHITGSDYASAITDMYERLTGTRDVPQDMLDTFVSRLENNWRGLDVLAVKMIKACGFWVNTDGSYGVPTNFKATSGLDYSSETSTDLPALQAQLADDLSFAITDAIDDPLILVGVAG